MTNNFAFEVKVDLCLKYTFTGGGWGWLDKSIIMLISAPVGFELGLGAELGNNTFCWGLMLHIYELDRCCTGRRCLS